jgi:hypothetical protein
VRDELHHLFLVVLEELITIEPMLSAEEKHHLLHVKALRIWAASTSSLPCDRGCGISVNSPRGLSVT